MEIKKTLLITPKTKVLELIETYPQLEEVLINYVPAFEKLKNPILRKTVARIASLQQAASVGNVKVEDLINVLRREVGQDNITQSNDSEYNTTQPSWFLASKIKQELDIRGMLAAGEQPVNQVLSDLHKLPENEIYLVIAPFIPAPLIDKATSLKINHWIDKVEAELFKVYFMK